MFAIDIIPLIDSEHNLAERFFRGQPVVLIGNDLECQLQHPLLQSLNFKVLIRKLAGSEFECKQIFTNSGSGQVGFQEIYDSTAKLNLGTVKILITSIDADLLVRENEAPDQAGYRLLKQAIVSQLPIFPALEISKPWEAVVSFNPEQVLTVGRAAYHHLVIEQLDVSFDHARFGFANNRYWVEDLGSTNGTFLNNQQVSGKIFFEPGDSVRLGASTQIKGLKKTDLVEIPIEIAPATFSPSEQRLDVVTEEVQEKIPSAPIAGNPQLLSLDALTSSEDAPTSEFSPVMVQAMIRDSGYPALVAVNKIARPGKLVLKPDQVFLIGRDANSDFWLGAPYVSREHNRITLLNDHSVLIQDTSSNGTAYSGGMIPAGGELIISQKSEILHYGSGLAVAICFNQSDEDTFVSSGGRADAFLEGQLQSFHEQEVLHISRPKLAGDPRLAVEEIYRPLRHMPQGELQEGLANKLFSNFLNFDLKRKIFVCCVSLLVIAIFVLLISIILTFL